MILSVLLSGVAFWTTSVNAAKFNVKTYDYNEVQFEEHSTFDQFKQRYLTGPGDTFAENVFVGVATEQCRDDLQSAAFRGAQRHGRVVSAALPIEEFPLDVNNCAEVFFYRVGSDIDHPSGSEADFDHPSMNSFVASQMWTEGIEIENRFDHAINVYWHEENNEPHLQMTLNAGERTSISSFLGHLFSANHADAPLDPELAAAYPDPGYHNIVDYFAVDGFDYTFQPLNRLETCEITPGSKMVFTERAVDNHLDHAEVCQDMALRFVEYANAEWYVRRLGLNYVQPQIIHSFSELGFLHRRLPEETYRWLKAWYDTEQQSLEITESGVGPCMNQHVAPSQITHLVPHLKEKLRTELYEIMEDWAQQGALELTSIYGIRRYNNGSVLRMHVDTARTHAVSAIINVDQEVDQDWPLIILDHDYNEHRLNMRPGDMLLYESAKALHGRPEAFVGSHYDNIFIHYAPVDKKVWDYDWL